MLATHSDPTTPLSGPEAATSQLTTADARHPLTQSTRAVLLRGAGFALGALSQAILGRALGPGDYGRYGAIMANVMLGAQIVDLGGELTTTRLLSSSAAAPKALLGSLVGLRIVLGGLLLFGVAAFVAALRPSGQLRAAFLLGALILPLGALASGRALLIAMRRMDRAQFAQLSQTVVSLTMIGGLAAAGALTLPAAIGTVAVGTAIAGAVYGYLTGWAGWGPRLRLRAVGRLASQSLPVGMILVITQLAIRVPTTIVVAVLGTAQAGYFFAAYRWVDLAHFLPQNIIPTVFPSLASLRPGTAGGRAYYALLSEGLLVAGTWLGGAFATGGPVLVGLLYGPRYQAATLLLPTLALALPGLFLAWAHGNLFVAQGDPRRQLWIASASAAAALAFYPLFAAHGGLRGAICATALIESTAAVGGALMVWRSYHLRPNWCSAGRRAALPMTLIAAAHLVSAPMWAAMPLALGCLAGCLSTLHEMLKSLPEESLPAAS